ncbi:endonuclease/exonuclease/phosphatase family protein [Cognatishimia activa]|uniref:Endonuclease/Exonuclease/phosphatase family protein n=1 Tax=Cognatishimia activa TaxID=1715691 RepID=A0A0P1ITG4_9RHOB|nr:endonuclease/exonuclease/phosphatase family protein [Cognatishimia activa]CUI78696.1 Endonuclease/Exonuclease/phosphatase family protein [Cognatishimia activa]CUK26820.1 Endonuclease/Exonuclease/phosphatase family protein [Cognatishimia activa]
MRIATYNVEWFTNLFDEENQLVLDDSWSARHDVTKRQQVEALGIVFTALDADAILVVEAPDQNSKRATVPALENFAKGFGLRAREAVIGFSNDTQQELALLYDPDVLTARHDAVSSLDAPRFDQQFQIDLDVDERADAVVFSKPPLELALTTKAGRDLRFIGAHLKSKAPHGARNRDDVMRISIANRRKQLAQAIWLRRRVVQHLKNGESLILAGDLNDGPGLDEYEDLFGRSSVEIILGEQGEDCLHDPHARAALGRRLGAQPTTSRFFIEKENRYLQALLDYIMVSADLRAFGPKWRIWHPFEDHACYRLPELREALLTASDHFPVTMDIDI